MAVGSDRRLMLSSAISSRVDGALVLNPDAQVRVVFEGDLRVPCFECEPCQGLMRLSGNRWVCPECGYDMTADEALLVIELAARRFELLRNEVKKQRGGWWWRARMWWRRRKSRSSRRSTLH